MLLRIREYIILLEIRQCCACQRCVCPRWSLVFAVFLLLTLGVVIAAIYLVLRIIRKILRFITG